MWVEVFGGIFAFFALSRVVLRFREGKISWGMMLVWCAVWAAVLVFLLSPTSFEPISRGIGIQRPLDLMLVGGLVLSYYLNFRAYIHLEEVRADLAKVVREVSLSKDKR